MDGKFLQRISLPILLTAVVASAGGASAANLVTHIRATGLGKIIVDGKGMSAYFFDLDKANSGTSACTGECAANWPAIISDTAKPRVSGISGKVGTISLASGIKQITINGRPIYTFAFDKAPGDTKGQGAQGVWFVISPSGNEIKTLKLAPAPSKSSKSRTYGRSNY